jgi:hypothetical protein
MTPPPAFVFFPVTSVTQFDRTVNMVAAVAAFSAKCAADDESDYFDPRHEQMRFAELPSVQRSAQEEVE